jgi:arylsulfatase A-like enzyme
MRFTIPLLLLFFIPLPLPVSGKVPTPRQARPNIVFIFIDDMGYADPACFGNPIVKTPNIDRLAAEGIKLTNFYVNSPICSPSRVAVTTGQYPARWKIHSYLNNRAGNKSRGMADYLDKAAPTTAKKLKAAGYSTAHFGKWHMGGGRDVDDAPLPADYGFDESLVAFEGLGDRLLVNPKNSSTRLGHGNISFCERWEKTEKYTDRAIDFIRRNKDKPWYVRLFPNDVHDAHVPLPGTEEPWKAASDNPWQHKFFAVLKEMDRQIGRLVDEIDALGLAENTLIVFTSDNGPTDWPKYYRDNSGGPPGFTGPFLGRKWSLFEGGIRMPFIARWKGRIPEGIVDKSSMMGGIDLSPTFCSLAGVQVPQSEKLDGH